MIKTFLTYAVGSFSLLIALSLLMSGDILSGLLMVGFALILMPKTRSRIESLLNRTLKSSGVLLIASTLFIGSIAMADTSEKNAADLSTETVAEEIVEDTDAKAENTLWTVTDIVDGDTIKVSSADGEETVRLIGINTPETVHPSKPLECFGEEASNKLKELLSDQQVTLESEDDKPNRDKYDRLLRYVFLQDGTFANKVMVEEGYAYEEDYGENYQYQAEFEQLQASAEANSVGLWSSDTCNGELEIAEAIDEEPTVTNTAETTESAVETTVVEETVQAEEPVIQEEPEVVQAPAPQPEPEPAPTTNGVVKLSTNNKCHAPGTEYYSRTKNFTPYNSIDECLAAGGVLPQ